MSAIHFSQETPNSEEPEKTDDENLELIEIILSDPDAENQVQLPNTPFPTIPVTPGPDDDDEEDDN